jgi:hypothetical protein
MVEGRNRRSAEGKMKDGKEPFMYGYGKEVVEEWQWSVGDP